MHACCWPAVVVAAFGGDAVAVVAAFGGAAVVAGVGLAGAGAIGGVGLAAAVVGVFCSAIGGIGIAAAGSCSSTDKKCFSAKFLNLSAYMSGGQQLQAGNPSEVRIFPFLPISSFSELYLALSSPTKQPPLSTISFGNWTAIIVLV